VLVVGELGWPLLDDGRPSNKLSRAGLYLRGCHFASRFSHMKPPM
jgi:hypothetical protein